MSCCKSNFEIIVSIKRGNSIILRQTTHKYLAKSLHIEALCVRMSDRKRYVTCHNDFAGLSAGQFVYMPLSSSVYSTQYSHSQG